MIIFFLPNFIFLTQVNITKAEKEFILNSSEAIFNSPKNDPHIIFPSFDTKKYYSSDVYN